MHHPTGLFGKAPEVKSIEAKPVPGSSILPLAMICGVSGLGRDEAFWRVFLHDHAFQRIRAILMYDRIVGKDLCLINLTTYNCCCDSRGYRRFQTEHDCQYKRGALPSSELATFPSKWWSVRSRPNLIPSIYLSIDR